MFSYLGVLITIVTTFHAIPAHAGQIPFVNGVIGGVTPGPSTTEQLYENLAQIPLNNVHHAQFDNNPVRTPGKIRIKSRNDGTCETTDGVQHATGYADLTSEDSLWYVTSIPSLVLC